MAQKPVFWLVGSVKTPPFSSQARLEAGALLGLLQNGLSLGMPHSRPLPSVGPRCHELRIKDETHEWRIIYRIDPGAIIVASIFDKKGKAMQQRELGKAKRALAKIEIFPKKGTQ